MKQEKYLIPRRELHIEYINKFADDTILHSCLFTPQGLNLNTYFNVATMAFLARTMVGTVARAGRATGFSRSFTSSSIGSRTARYQNLLGMKFSGSTNVCNSNFRQFHNSASLLEDEEAIKVVTSDTPVDPKIEELADQITALNLIEASQLADCLKEKLGIEDTPMMMGAMPGAGVAAGAAGGAPAAEEVVEEKTHFDVKLLSFDASSKLKVIKEVRALAGLGLKEAKEFVEGAPKVIKENVAKEEAEAMVEKLKALGAEVELE